MAMRKGQKRSPYPLCKEQRKDCFGYGVCGRCTVLTDTDFGKKPCPFYKSRRQYDTDSESS